MNNEQVCDLKDQRLLEAALYVQDIVLDNIECYSLDTVEKFESWLDEYGPQLDEDAHNLFVGNPNLPPALLTDLM